MMPRSGNDHVIDVIASVESDRQRIEKDAGLAASCGEALRRLHELLDLEREAFEVRAPGTRHPNIEAVALEIARVKKLLGNTRRDASASVPRPGHVLQ